MAQFHTDLPNSYKGWPKLWPKYQKSAQNGKFSPKKAYDLLIKPS
jgi:hypothetical protein